MLSGATNPPYRVLDAFRIYPADLCHQHGPPAVPVGGDHDGDLVVAHAPFGVPVARPFVSFPVQVPTSLLVDVQLFVVTFDDSREPRPVDRFHGGEQLVPPVEYRLDVDPYHFRGLRIVTLST